jgi:thioredoxin 1
MGLLQTTTEAEFEKHVIKNNKLVLVDFWAEWCAPCRAIAPTLEKLAKTMDKELDIVKVNIEASPDNSMLAGSHGVQSIPNMQVFKNGEKIDELIGMRSEAVLEAELKEYL